MNQKDIITIAHYIKEGNGHTMSETAEHFGYAKSTIQKYIQKLGDENSPFFDKKLYNQVRLAQEKMRLLKAREGGKTGKRGPSTSEFDLEEIATVMIEERLSLSVASSCFQIPVSTLYDGLHRLGEPYQTAIQQLYDDNKTQNKFDGVRRF